MQVSYGIRGQASRHQVRIPIRRRCSPQPVTPRIISIGQLTQEAQRKRSWLIRKRVGRCRAQTRVARLRRAIPAPLSNSQFLTAVCHRSFET